MKISFLRIIMELKHPKNGKRGGEPKKNSRNFLFKIFLKVKLVKAN